MDQYDAIIRQCLKQWIVRYAPPANGRVRLLQEAIASSKHRFHPITTSWGGKMRPLHSLEIPSELFSWAIIYTLERGIATKNMVS